MLLVEHLTLMPLLLPLYSVPQHRAYRDMIQDKCETFRTAKTTRNGYHLTNCGALSMCCWAVVASGHRMTSERRKSIDILRRRSLVCAHCWYTTAVIYVRTTKLRNVRVPTSYCRRSHPHRSSFGEQAMFQWPSLDARL